MRYYWHRIVHVVPSLLSYSLGNYQNLRVQYTPLFRQCAKETTQLTHCQSQLPISVVRTKVLFFRTIDPTVDLMQVYNSHMALPLPAKFWKGLIDKPPSSKDEFILRNIGGASKHIPEHGFMEQLNGGGMIPDATAKDSSNKNLILVDRSACLKVDPIRIHAVNSYIMLAKSPSPLKFRGCEDINLSECKEISLPVGKVQTVPAIRTLLISWDERYDSNNFTCSESTEEDIIIEIKRI
mmetsp:Transcript_15641/g.33874  ORF Transcript_15641/g.33874 Transcript_15641/m.33874 type:complete len:238 (+) Transcript_15641:351-1064(+)